MAEKNIDKLLSLTDSKYRLSVVIAKRALQLRAGVPPVIPPEDRVGTRNLVTLAMREMATEKLEWGEGLVDESRLQGVLDRTRQAHNESLAASQPQPNPFAGMPDFERD